MLKAAVKLTRQVMLSVSCFIIDLNLLQKNGALQN